MDFTNKKKKNQRFGGGQQSSTATIQQLKNLSVSLS